MIAAAAFKHSFLHHIRVWYYYIIICVMVRLKQLFRKTCKLEREWRWLEILNFAFVIEFNIDSLNLFSVI